MQNLNQSARDDDILYADRSSKDEQLSLRPFLWKTKTMNMKGGQNGRCSNF
jgi:hypothetical protein